jgi:hypothetical protein
MYLWTSILKKIEFMIVASGDNSCRYANDGECDVPQYCAVGTDATDCGGEFVFCDKLYMIV